MEEKTAKIITIKKQLNYPTKENRITQETELSFMTYLDIKDFEQLYKYLDDGVVSVHEWEAKGDNIVSITFTSETGKVIALEYIRKYIDIGLDMATSGKDKTIESVVKIDDGYQEDLDNIDHKKIKEMGNNLMENLKNIRENKMLVADFSNARVGDRVKCLDGIDGIIESINVDNGEFSVDCCNGNRAIRINKNGITEYGLCPVWFYYFDTQFPTIESCTRPLPKIEVDEKVYVYNRTTRKWNGFHFAYFDRDDLWVFFEGRAEWNCDGYGTEKPKYWKLASDPKINSGNLHEIEGDSE